MSLTRTIWLEALSGLSAVEVLPEMRAEKARPIDRGLARISDLFNKSERSNLVLRCPFHNAAIVARGLEPHLINEHNMKPRDAALIRARAVHQAQAG